MNWCEKHDHFKRTCPHGISCPSGRCEIEWLNQRIREQEELLKFYRERKSEAQVIERFLSRLRIMSGTGNGIGASTVSKIWQFAIQEGFIDHPEPPEA